jgi:hypothetical protein
MFGLIQFYVQLSEDLSDHRPLLKVLAIKAVIFLSFWQSSVISIVTSSTIHWIEPGSKVAYPDIKVGIPALLLCFEMAIFAVVHLFAFPYSPYTSKSARTAPPKHYPVSPASDQPYPVLNELGPKQGGFLGFFAMVDAMNPWDLVKAFARGMRWLFVGVRHREKDISYQKNTEFDTPETDNEMTPGAIPKIGRGHAYKNTADLPIAMEFRRSKFGMPTQSTVKEEEATLLANAQNPGSGYVPARQRYDLNGQDISSGGTSYDSNSGSPDRLVGGHGIHEQSEQIGMALSDSSPHVRPNFL